MDLEPGTQLFGYVVERTLGRGAMGTVYLARQVSLDRPVALKVLHPSRVANANAARDFFQEAVAAGRLTHANLVTVHDLLIDAERGIYAYSMEYVHGPTVGSLITQNGIMRPAVALPLAMQVAAALGHAHRHRLVHRDVKPDNILVTEAREAKLLDLGLAYNRVAGLGVGSGSESAGQRRLVLVGTPGYAAPEQCRNPQRSSPASDVWSLGATLCVMLTGALPYNGETVIDLIVRASAGPPPLPATLEPGVRGLLLRLLAPGPAQRPQDGLAAAELIRALVGGSAPASIRAPVAVAAPSEVVTVSTPKPSRNAARRLGR